MLLWILRWLRRLPELDVEMLTVPRGRVLIDGKRRWVRAFAMDARPVTNAEWVLFMEATGARRPAWLYKTGFGEFEHPEFLAAVDRILEACRKHGKAAGFLDMNIDRVLRFREKGFRLLGYGHDVVVFQKGLREGLERIQDDSSSRGS